MTKQLGNIFEPSKPYATVLRQLGNQSQTKKRYFVFSLVLILNMKLLLLPCSNHQDHHTLSLSHNFKALIREKIGSQTMQMPPMHSHLKWPSTDNNNKDIHNLPRDIKATSKNSLQHEEDFRHNNQRIKTVPTPLAQRPALNKDDLPHLESDV